MVELPLQIQELNAKHAAFTEKLSFGALDIYGRALLEVTEAYDKSTDKIVRAAIAIHWLNRFEINMQYPDMSALISPHVDACLKQVLMACEQHALEVTEQYAVLISALCVTRAVHDETGRYSKKYLNNQLLKALTSTDIDPTRILNVDEIVDLTYGPGLRVLYGDEFPRSNKLAEYLWRSKFTPAGLVKVSDRAKNVIIPGDLAP